jgi:hypothetical protein
MLGNNKYIGTTGRGPPTRTPAPPPPAPPAATTFWSRAVNMCGILHVKRWCLIIALLAVLTIGFMVPFIIYATFFGEATSCRLTYAEHASFTEADMQGWTTKDTWPLSVPTYDPWRRTCVCKGYEDKDPKQLQPTDEVLVWIAPGDLVSLSDENKLPSKLDDGFTSKYRRHYAQEEHVKVCLPQRLVLDLWNIASDTADGGRHCHQMSSATPSNVERFYLGWDGTLFCEGGSSPSPPPPPPPYPLPPRSIGCTCGGSPDIQCVQTGSAVSTFACNDVHDGTVCFDSWSNPCCGPGRKWDNNIPVNQWGTGVEVCKLYSPVSG